MRRFGLRAGAVTACAIGLSGLLGVSTAGAVTSPTPAPATTLSPGSAAPAAAGAPATARAVSLPSQDQGCPVPASRLQMQCQIIISHAGKAAGQVTYRRGAAPRLTPVQASLGPGDLRAAYALASASTSRGAGETVAIVDAFGDSHIASDLANYRSQWNLPACDSATGAGCLTVVNQNGASTPLPANPTGMNLGWEDETALDVEMVSAICPNCAIELFQAKSPSLPDLGTAENSAARVAKFISNSWGGGDFPGETFYDSQFFNHPGVASAFASGDFGFGASYPASSGLVTSVGGTFLTPDSASPRGFDETVWSGGAGQHPAGTGAGCSSGEGKPSWQADAGCQNRTENDVSAVADAPFGIDIYSSSGDCNNDGAFGTFNDCMVWGTSAATPIITSVYALAGNPVPNTYPSSYLYQAGQAAHLNDITSGQVGSCESNRLYLCRAGLGYDGPTGWGTPNGTLAFSSAVTHTVSLVNPGGYDLLAGARYVLPAMKAYDSMPGQTLAYSATGLPAGLAINTTNGVIEGVLSATPANAIVKVTVKDGTGASAASATVSFRIASVKSLTASYHATSGLIRLAALGNGSECMNDAHNGTASGNPVVVNTCQNVASENGWSYGLNAAPGVPGTIRIHGLCLGANSLRKVAIYTCNGSAGERWFLGGFAGEIVNAASGLCVQGSTVNGAQLTVAGCNLARNQAWLMPAAPITSGVAGKCLALNGSSVVSASCAVTSSQEITLGFDGSLQVGGKCIYKTGGSLNDGTAVGILTCNSGASELWGISAYGQLENLVSQKCLAIPNNSATSNTRLVIEDCYNQPGEVWGVS